jgi:hypothetical protein
MSNSSSHSQSRLPSCWISTWSFHHFIIKLNDVFSPHSIFEAYGGMDVTVQDMIQELITPLIKRLGPAHGKLLTLLRNFPPGAESLALRILKIFTEHGRPGTALVALVKGLIAERELDIRFLMPIIAEMDKAEIVKHLPRVIDTLNGSAENKALVKSVFSSIISAPTQVTTNLPRVRQSELLTPAELMVFLHESEKDVKLKSAVEAIGICFSMTDVYKPEVLGAVMQQIVDQPALPTSFLRTVRPFPYSSIAEWSPNSFNPRFRLSKRLPLIARSYPSCLPRSSIGSSSRRYGQIRRSGKASSVVPKLLHPRATLLCCSSPRISSGTSSISSRVSNLAYASIFSRRRGTRHGCLASWTSSALRKRASPPHPPMRQQ